MSEDIRVEFVADPDAEPAAMDALTRAVRAEILEIDEVDRVEQASAGPAPAGAKGLDASAIGALVVGVTPGVQAIVKVVEVLRKWLVRQPAPTPPLQLTVGDK